MQSALHLKNMKINEQIHNQYKAIYLQKFKSFWKGDIGQ